LEQESALLSAPGILVDVGFGTSAITTHELSVAFPRHAVIGLERDAQRVEAAAREFPGLRVRRGDLDVLPDGGALVLRIANVARGLTREQAKVLHVQAGAKLTEGGVVLEGSTDVEGHVAAFFSLRRRSGALACEALVFATDGARGFSPWLFRDVLPRALRRDVRAGTPIHQLLTHWEACWTPHRTSEPAVAFRSSGQALAKTRRDIEVHGDFVRWTAPGSP
jgi:hypothetical protein